VVWMNLLLSKWRLSHHQHDAFRLVMACFYTIGMGNGASLWEDVLAWVSRLYPACVPRMISMRTDREKEGKERGMKGILDGPASLNVVEVELNHGASRSNVWIKLLKLKFLTPRAVTSALQFMVPHPNKSSALTTFRHSENIKPLVLYMCPQILIFFGYLMDLQIK
jgi:hypothetical protein